MSDPTQSSGETATAPAPQEQAQAHTTPTTTSTPPDSVAAAAAAALGANSASTLFSSLGSAPSSASSSSFPLNGGTASTSAGKFKLFVGNLPYEWNEASLRSVFIPYGEIVETVVLKERSAGAGSSKGCGFVVFTALSSAENAIIGLNDRQLPNCPKPLIVRFAGERPSAVEEHKLFVCMLSRSTTEMEMRSLFLQFGEVIDIHLMRNYDGTSRGQGFIKFKTKDAAIKAIDALNAKYTDKDASAPLEVRFAQTKNERDNARVAAGINIRRPPPSSIAGAAGPRYEAYRPGVPAPQSYAQPAASSYPHPQQQYYGGAAAAPQAPAALSAYGGAPAAAQWDQYGAYGQSAASYAAPAATSTYANPYAPAATAPYSTTTPYASYTPAATAGAAPSSMASGARGPEGANLFVHGLPDEFTEPQLKDLFQPFGTLLSVKINMDPQTNRSKGFGFVSYASPHTAYTAMTTLDGMQIGGRRIQVKLKTERTAGKPY